MIKGFLVVYEHQRKEVYELADLFQDNMKILNMVHNLSLVSSDKSVNE
jgi:cephalosporin-C deacetylase-like acetyl esterase